MAGEIGLFEAMGTQRAIRYFKGDAVPREAVERLLEAATRAPSGTNRQMWHFCRGARCDVAGEVGGCVSEGGAQCAAALGVAAGG